MLSHKVLVLNSHVVWLFYNKIWKVIRIFYQFAKIKISLKNLNNVAYGKISTIATTHMHLAYAPLQCASEELNIVIECSKRSAFWNCTFLNCTFPRNNSFARTNWRLIISRTRKNLIVTYPMKCLCIIQTRSLKISVEPSTNYTLVPKGTVALEKVTNYHVDE